MTQIEKEVSGFLKTLGSGPNKIAENLAAMKIKGTLAEGSDCPIVKCLRKKFKNLKSLSVAEDVEFTYKGEEYAVKYPAAVGKFIENFDDGKYPAITTKTSLANAS
jgi:hypothetical protein